MPKVKTNKVTRNRFRITKNGKVMHRTQGMRHIRRNKSKTRQRSQDRGSQLTTQKNKVTVKRFLET